MKLAVLTTLAAVAVAAAAWFVAPKLHRFAYWAQQKDRAAVAALAQDGWRVDVLAPEPGVELVGLLHPPAAPGAAWILLLPGNAQDVTAAFRPVLDPLVSSRGVGAAFWPWRGFDASTGTPSPAGLLADARAAWRRCLELAGGPDRIELWGYSLGAGLAVQLAAELCAGNTPPRRLVLLSAYDCIAVMRAGTLGRLLPGDVYDAAAAASRVTCDVMMVHGSDDDALPIESARALRRAFGPRARLVELLERGHVDYLRDLAVMQW